MKNLIISILFIISTNFSFSQNQFWSNDFSTQSDWTMVDLLNGGLQNWVITTNAPVGSFSGTMGIINSTTAANGFALFDSDALNTQYTPQEATLTYNGAIDCSAYPYININFECYHRVFRDSVFVEISTDNFATVAGRYRIQPDLATNESSPNPDFVSLNISSSAGNQSNVYLRFHYEGEWDYAIMIDDVTFSEIPDYELECTYETFSGWWLGYQSLGDIGIEYSMYPIGQSAANPYRMEAVIANTGVNTLNNVTLHVDIEEPNGNINSHLSNATNLVGAPNQAIDTVATTNSFNPSSLGLHNFSFWATSDSFPSTDTTIKSSIVTDSVYAVDYDWNNNGSNLLGNAFLGRTCGGQVLANVFDIYQSTMLTSISFHVSSSSVVGSIVAVQLYETDGQIFLDESNQYSLTAADIGNWVTIPLSSSINLFAGTSYMAAVRGFQHPTDTSLISTSTNAYTSSYIQDNGCNLNSANPAGTWYTSSNSYAIRMNFGLVIAGCTDPIAINYNPLANLDDGSCILLSGCTDSTAINYNPLATIDDGSCIFSCLLSNCTDYLCPSEGSNLNDGFVGLAYQSFINFSIPLDTSVILSGLTLNVTISNVDVTSVIGLPNNFSYSCSNPTTCSFVGGSNGCLELYSLTSPLVSDTGAYHIQIITSTLAINVPLIGSITQIDTIDYFLEIKNSSNIGGCIDSLACNFNSFANIDDSSCVYNQSNLIILTQCNSYVWDGVTYDSTGIYTNIYPASNGCDSTVTLDLTINNSSSSTVLVTNCDSYTWDGMTYDSTGLYTNVYPASNGCDSSVTLDLTINNSSSSTVSVTNCDSYTWDGVSYGLSGSYTNSYTDLNGCDSIVTLDLIINQSTTSLTLDSALGSYVWNGNTYSSSGTYTANLTNSLGCDSIATLELVIFANTWDCVSGACIDPGNGQGTYASLSACQSNCVLPTWDCVGGVVCVDPGTGLGTFSSLSACQSNCVITATWDCVGGSCIDPGNGQGTYASLTACQANCTNTSLELNMINDFNIYPNPNEGIFRVSFSANSTDLIELRVINPLGEDIFFDQLSSFDGEYDKKINLSNYANGVYFMSINSGSELILKKIIIN